jgi:hypothetical protein
MDAGQAGADDRNRSKAETSEDAVNATAERGLCPKRTAGGLAWRAIGRCLSCARCRALARQTLAFDILNGDAMPDLALANNRGNNVVSILINNTR